MGKNPATNGIGGNSAVAVDHNFGDDILLRVKHAAQQHY
jgi:hypothetical protein